MIRKNGFLTFCTSFIPGVGQMYQGYMKRGLSILILFFACIALGILLPMPIFSLPIPVVMIYSFFDTYSIRNKIKPEDEPQDVYIWNKWEIGNSELKSNLNKRHTFLGIALLIFGVYLIFNTLLSHLAFNYNILWLQTIIGLMRNYIPIVIIGAVSIAVGIKFISKK